MNDPTVICRYPVQFYTIIFRGALGGHFSTGASAAPLLCSNHTWICFMAHGGNRSDTAADCMLTAELRSILVYHRAVSNADVGVRERERVQGLQGNPALLCWEIKNFWRRP